jgi:LysR family transcriptional regulator, regulator for metE and metH
MNTRGDPFGRWTPIHHPLTDDECHRYSPGVVPTFDVRDLSLVREIADTGSVTRASSRLHLTQSALSHRLRTIESRLGTPLFLRVGKKMVSTPAGDRLLLTARQVLDALGRTEEELRALAREGVGVLRICTQCYTGYHWLPPLLRVFQSRHPRVDVQIAVDATYRPLEALRAGEIDLALLTMNVEDPRILARPLFQDEMLAVVAPSHPLAARKSIELSDLSAEHLITYKTDRRESYVLTRILEPAGIEPARISQVPLTEAILEMVKADMGVAILARWAVEPAVRSGSVRTLKITRQGVTRQWSAATLRGPEPRWRADFVALLREHGPSAPLPARPRRRSTASSSRAFA